MRLSREWELLQGEVGKGDERESRYCIRKTDKSQRETSTLDLYKRHSKRLHRILTLSFTWYKFCLFSVSLLLAHSLSVSLT